MAVAIQKELSKAVFIFWTSMMLSQMTECAFRIQTLRRQITPGEYDRSLCSMKTALTGSSPEECKNTLCFINEQLVSSLGKATACKALRNSGLSYNNLNVSLKFNHKSASYFQIMTYLLMWNDFIAARDVYGRRYLSCE